jgi:SAM-dependent methyltransferase
MPTAADTRTTVHRACPACGRDNRDAPASPYGPPEWPLKHCACGLTYIEQAPVYEELEATHAWEKSAVRTAVVRQARHPLMTAMSKATRWRMRLLRRKRADRMATALTPEGAVLDLGCGKGTQLAGLPPHLVPYGIEISRAEADLARDRLAPRGGVVICAPAVEGLQEVEPDRIDCAILRSYLEHEARPAAVLEELHRVLRPGGAVVVKVPNYGSLNRVLMGRRWCGFRFPDHLNYFTPRSLVGMFEQAGFTRFRMGFMDRFPLNDNMWLVAYKRS